MGYSLMEDSKTKKKTAKWAAVVTAVVLLAIAEAALIRSIWSASEYESKLNTKWILCKHEITFYGVTTKEKIQQEIYPGQIFDDAPAVSVDPAGMIVLQIAIPKAEFPEMLPDGKKSDDMQMAFKLLNVNNKDWMLMDCIEAETCTTYIYVCNTVQAPNTISPSLCAGIQCLHATENNDYVQVGAWAISNVQDFIVPESGLISKETATVVYEKWKQFQ